MNKISEDELRDILDKAARNISELSSHPRAWQSWLVYLLGRLEAEAMPNPAYMDAFKEMLVSLQDELRNRLKTGGW
jgi:hypothetical protein